MDNNNDPIREFETERENRIAGYGKLDAWKGLSTDWMQSAFAEKYMYNFAWGGRPIIQLPSDMVAFQEVVWAAKPDLIIETGIAHGGSLILSASLLAMLDYCDAVATGGVVDPKTAKRRVLGIDIDIRAHNKAAIEAHPLSSKIDMFEGSSIEQPMIERVHDYAKDYERVLVCLDSNHTHDHVLAELNAYADLATKDSYCLVFDTVIEDLPADTFPDRPWAPGNNAKTAVHEFLKSHPEFAIDQEINQKLLISAAPDGWLKRIG
ncbi:cephalosporin hydroxylase family protein [Roseibium aggregatum]|uniref:Cephalosporin hydroxylase family protein n=1 Tax=Roseibium aggregatum TaxID=187304 RepID=A0A939EG86_9HYPH|nr:cephalosporin hydroxylase family protein [Roseibium aggregatum]MBN9672661.1 cephalosporin hydroxylase family protein [Roseibium aggregatum]